MVSAAFDTISLDAGVGFAKRNSHSPNSLDPLTLDLKRGLIPVGLSALLSLVSLSALLAFITHRLIFWRRHYKDYVGYNQNVILIYNLLLADLQQSIAFLISFHWLRINKIIEPTTSCLVQAWFTHLGDVSSGFFVFAIAIHTWMGVVHGYSMRYSWFVAAIMFIWLAAFTLTVLGPIMHGSRFFGRAGGWCWVSSSYEKERLYLHYLWIFICEFGTMALYTRIFIHLRYRIQTIINTNTNTRKLTRATKFMVLYPAVYVILTLPIAVGRMVVMTGTELSDTFFCVVGALLTSCGWIDALLYTLTRRIILSSDLTSQDGYNRNITVTTTNAARPGDDVGLQYLPGDAAAGTARTVTITGGAANRLSRLVNHRDGRSPIPEKSNYSSPLHDNSSTGSQESIIKSSSRFHGIGIITETSVQVDSVSVDNNYDNKDLEGSLHTCN